MNTLTLVFLPLALTVFAVAGLRAWQRWHPASFWYGAGYPFRLVLVGGRVKGRKAYRTSVSHPDDGFGHCHGDSGNRSDFCGSCSAGG